MGAIDYVQQKQLLLNTSGLREKLSKFDREEIFEVYFRRIDGRFPSSIPDSLAELYIIEMDMLATYLLDQYPNDTLMQKILIMC